jgi:capsular exopolysaccharide synthesis family protein
MFRVLWRKGWLVLLFGGVAFGAIDLYLRNTPSVYEASALIELSVRRPRVMNQQGAVIEDGGVSLQSDEVFNTRLQKFQSSAAFDLAATIYRQTNAACTSSVPALAEEFKKTAKFTLLRRTRLVKIMYRHQEPAEAMMRAGAIATAAETSATQENRVSSDGAVAWLNGQVTVQRRELEKADHLVLEFRSTNMIDMLENRKKTVEDSLLTFNRSLVDIESQQAMAKDLLTTLASFEADPANLGKMPATAPRADEIRAAHEKWVTSMADRDALLVRYTKEHPEVQAREKAVASLLALTVDTIRRSRETARANVSLLEKQAESLRAKKAEQSALATDLEQKIVTARTQLQVLQRERDVAETSYRALLSRVEEARLAADENTATAKIIERPRLPDPEKPVWPRRRLLMAMAIAFGLGAGFLLALIVDRLEDYIVSPFDIEQDLGLPLAGAIPHVHGGGKRHTVAIACLRDKLSPFAEAFAGLRTVLDSPKYRPSTGTILVSSSMPSEGKTVVSTNLAVTLALHGQRVLLIDFDLRRPRMAGLFHMPADRPGLLDVLIGKEKADFANLPFETECPNLKVIGSRPVKDRSPSDVMGGAAVRELIAWAKANFDRVILDAPPLGIVSDAAVLAGFADSVILVIRIDESRKRGTAYTVNRFKDVGVSQVLAVGNDVNYKRGHHAYGKYYSYHYRAYVKGGG